MPMRTLAGAPASAKKWTLNSPLTVGAHLAQLHARRWTTHDAGGRGAIGADVINLQYLRELAGDGRTGPAANFLRGTRLA